MIEPTHSLSEVALRQLHEMASWSGQSEADTLETLIREQYDRKFWDAVNSGYAELRNNAGAWAAESAERRVWESALMDGLDSTESWNDDGSVAPSPARDKAS